MEKKDKHVSLKEQVLLPVSEDLDKIKRCHRFSAFSPSPVPCSRRPGGVHSAVKTNVTLSRTALFAALRHLVVTHCQPDTAAMASKANYRRHEYVANQPDVGPVNRLRSMLMVSCGNLKMGPLFD